MMSPIVVSGGATPFITKRVEPNGGDVVAISVHSRTTTANHTGLNPRSLIIGIKRGTVISTMAEGDMNIPKKSRAITIPMTMNIGSRDRVVTKSISPRVAPLAARIWL